MIIIKIKLSKNGKKKFSTINLKRNKINQNNGKSFLKLIKLLFKMMKMISSYLGIY